MPRQETAYDRLLAPEGCGLLLAALGNYESAALAGAHELLRHPHCARGLGDGGARGFWVMPR